MGKLTLNKKRYIYKNVHINKFPTKKNDYLEYRYHRLFFGSLIQRGRKLWAFAFLIDLKSKLKKRLLLDPNKILHSALLKITPQLLLIPKKIGSTTYGVPVYIGLRKQLTFAVKWVIKLLRDKYRRLRVEDVSESLIGSLFNKGLSFEKKMEVYKTAEENRHLLRYIR